MRRFFDDVAALGQAMIALALLFLLVCTVLAPVLLLLGFSNPFYP